MPTPLARARDDAGHVRAVAVVIEGLRRSGEVGAIHAAPGEILVAAVDAGVEHGDLGAGAALSGDHGGGALRPAPHHFRVDVVDAVLQRVSGDVDGIDGIELDVADKRQPAQPLGIADNGEGAAEAR